jgi:hypothetical protein
MVQVLIVRFGTFGRRSWPVSSDHFCSQDDSLEKHGVATCAAFSYPLAPMRHLLTSRLTSLRALPARAFLRTDRGALLA